MGLLEPAEPPAGALLACVPSVASPGSLLSGPPCLHLIGRCRTEFVLLCQNLVLVAVALSLAHGLDLIPQLGALGSELLGVFVTVILLNSVKRC